MLTMVIPLWALLQGASPTEIGVLVGAKSMLTFFLAIHGGALMDRFGTRRVMLFFAVTTGSLAACYPLLPWLPVMIALQMLIGFASNMGWIGAQTIIAQVAAGDPGLIGRFSFFARMGNVIAPLMMGLLWDHAGPMLSFLGVAVWSTMLFLAVTRIENPQSAETLMGRFSWRDIMPRLSDYTGSLSLIVIPAVAFTLAVSFMRHATNGVENSFFIVYLQDVGFAGTMIGALFAIAEIVNGLGSLLSGRADKVMPRAWLMVSFTMLSIVLLAITPFLGGAFVVLAIAHCLRRGFEGVVQPFIFSLQARAVPRNLQGSVVGLRVTGNRLSSVLTPIIMGLLVDHLGLAMGFVAMGGLLLAIGMALVVVLLRKPGLGQ